MASIHLPIRQLVEFLLRTGSIDSRFAGFDRANEGARIHRRLQKAAGEGYQAEVFLSAEREACGIAFTLEGRADGIFTDETGTVTIDEIKTTTVPYEEITEELNPCHWAQGMVYAAIYSSQQGLETLAVRLTYYQVDTDQIQRFTRQFSQQQLEQFLQQLLTQYAPWAQRQLDWDTRRSQSLAALQFPFAEYRPGQRALAGEVYRACRAGKSTDRKGGTRVFCQAPTGIGKTMSALFPALKACRTARPCPAQRDPDRQGKSLSAPGRRRPPRLPAGGVSLCQRLLRPPQGRAGGSAGRQRQFQPRRAGGHRPAVLGVSL